MHTTYVLPTPSRLDPPALSINFVFNLAQTRPPLIIEEELLGCIPFIYLHHHFPAFIVCNAVQYQDHVLAHRSSSETGLSFLFGYLSAPPHHPTDLWGLQDSATQDLTRWSNGCLIHPLPDN